MKIIIAGAGAVGTHLAKLLSRERHDITLIDEKPDRLENLAADFDLMTIERSPMSLEALREADTQKADLFIAVTPDESHNMTCCMLAKQLGARKTVARVDNYEYMQADNAAFFTSAGIDSMIYPEMVAGAEIAQSIKRSWVRQAWEFPGSGLVFMGVKLRESARILGRPLKDIAAADDPYHIVAVKRGGDTFIPNGSSIIEAGDLVYFMTTQHYINYLREVSGKDDYPDVKTVFIMGGGSTAVHTVLNMPDYMNAKIFERDEARSRRLAEVLRDKNAMIIHGDGRDADLLEDEGISAAHAFVALTENSESNILACLSAKRQGVRKTVAMVENTEYISMAESLDIGTIVNKKTLAASHIYRMMLKADVTTVKSLTVANADVCEIAIPEGSRVTRRPVRELSLPSTVTLGGLVREGKGMLVNGSTQIRGGDTVVAFCTAGSVKKIEKIFK